MTTMQQQVAARHRRWVSEGRFEQAHRLLRFLVTGAIKLYIIRDEDWDAEVALNQLGFPRSNDRYGNTTFYSFGRL